MGYDTIQTDRDYRTQTLGHDFEMLADYCSS